MTESTTILDPADSRPTTRRVHSRETWESVRDAFLSGEAGASVAARHGVSETAFWRHAAEKGWLRRDHPEAPPSPFDPDRPTLDDAAQLGLIDRRLAWALERGDAGESMRWLRMRDRIELRGLRLREAEEAAERRDARDRRAHIDEICDVAHDIQKAAKAELANVQGLLRRQRTEAQLARRESRESKKAGHADASPPSALLDPDAPGLSRAERRRRLKYRARHAPAPPS